MLSWIFGLSKQEEPIKAKDPEESKKRVDLPSKEDRIEEVLTNFYIKEKRNIDSINYSTTVVIGGPNTQKDADAYLGNIKSELIEAEYKRTPTFHGGCLSCHAPEHLTIACCYQCEYYNWVGGGKYEGEIIDFSRMNYPAKIRNYEIKEKNLLEGYIKWKTRLK